MENSSWSERLRHLMQQRGLSKAQLSRRSGINYDSINKYVRGEVDNPRGDVFSRLAEVLGCQVEWLVFGSDQVEPLSSSSGGSPGGIPFYGDVRAGAWLEVNALHEPSFEHIPLIRDPRYGAGEQFAVRVVGDSMDLIFTPGTYLICVSLPSLGREPKENELVIAEKTMSGLKEVTVKRFCLEGGQILLKPESRNPVHQSIIFNPQHTGGESENDGTDVSIIALVIGEYKRY